MTNLSQPSDLMLNHENPTETQAAIFYGPGLPMSVTSIPIPSLIAQEALVAIECSTICGSDLHTITGRRTEPTPTILGHESVGRVVALGTPPPRLLNGDCVEIGDRVTWSTTVSCHQCDRCRRGLLQKCRSLSKYGHSVALGREALSGGFAKHVLLRVGSSIAKVSDAMRLEVACPANCATATVACALRNAHPVNQARVLILGAGMLGLTAAAMAKWMSASQVKIVDKLDHRLELAKRFGADILTLWSAGFEDAQRPGHDHPADELFDIVLEFSGSSDAVGMAIRSADVGGRVIIAGTVLPSPVVSLDPESLVRRCISIHGVHNYAPEDLVTALSFLEECGESFPFAELVEKKFQLADINLAVDFAMQKHPVRIAIHPS